MQLKDKAAIITGGASGIGLAAARLFAANGAQVHVLELDAESSIESGGSVTLHRCDVADHKQVRQIIAAIAEQHGIDILVNNAGIAHVGSVESTSEEDMDRLYSVNVKGVYHCIQAAMPALKKSRGVILNLASIASSVGIPDRFAYSMTKGAVLSMTLSVARDYLADGVRCNCISPARVHTPFVDGFLAENYPGREAEMLEVLSQSQPIGRMGQPAEVAELIMFLCSDKAAFITGADYPIDGGFIKLNG